MLTSQLIESLSPAVLALADGSVFLGYLIGANQSAVGEVVFNTAMTGYQEVLTDPSYAKQMVTMTYPHIGNVGINECDHESSDAHAAGLIIRELSPIVSNWRASQSLASWLSDRGVTAIAGVDTRRLTRLIREKGAQSGCILPGDNVDYAMQLAQEFKGLEGADLAKEVSTSAVYSWQTPTDHLIDSPLADSSFHVVVYDFGVKQQILRLLTDRGCRVTVVPAKTPVDQVMSLNPDGVFLSNGPGDPAACDYAINAAQVIMDRGIPLFGICLGFQIIALACGAKTVKMKFGHHGANHPVKELSTGRVFITSQNHSFCVDQDSLPHTIDVTHVSLFDGTLQGIQHNSKPVIAFQGHPEASPGPQDIFNLFDQFVSLLTVRRDTHAKTS